MSRRAKRTTAIPFPTEAIQTLCARFGVKELCVFGSVLTSEFGPDSDVDFLVVFDSDDLGPWMSRVTDLAEELQKLIGRKVDLALKDGLKWVIRDRVLSEAQVLNAA